ncbi:MAG TPA: bacteriohemerythrin [Anaeromyxobacter sp.]|nr:bacteriohemerythrin [Anaeromyxobacter sp.]
MALRWTSALEIGVPEIDKQHEELFERVDRLYEAILAKDRAGAVRFLDYLRDYVEQHFQLEDGLMEALSYPDRAAHTAEHAHFAGVVADLTRTLLAQGATAGLVHRVEREVTAWLSTHIYSADLALGRFVQARHPREALAG